MRTSTLAYVTPVQLEDVALARKRSWLMMIGAVIDAKFDVS